MVIKRQLHFMEKIISKTFDEERALYGSDGVSLQNRLKSLIDR